MSIFDEEKLKLVSGNSNELSILSYDVNSIQRYIFQSSNIKAIMGSSKMIDEFDKEIQNMKEFYVVTAVGGTGMVIAPSDREGEVKEMIKSKFYKMVPGGEITISSVRFKRDELANGIKNGKNYKIPADIAGIKFENMDGKDSYSDIFKIFSSEMQRQKSLNNPKAPLFEDAQRCELCGVMPASSIYHFADGDLYICSACELKIQKGKEKIREEGYAEELADISLSEMDKNWIGFIKVDINNLGNLYSKIKTSKEFEQKSGEIEDIIQSSINKVVNVFNLRNKYLVPIHGGDDLFMMVPASKVVDIFKTLSSSLSSLSKMGLSFSAGLGISNVKMPIKFIFESAEALISSAKKSAYTSDKNENFVAFKIISSNSIDPVIEDVLYEDEKTKNIYKLGFGMSLSQFFNDLAFVEKLRNQKLIPFLQKTYSCVKDRYEVAGLNVNYFFARSEMKRVIEDPIQYFNKFALTERSEADGKKVYESKIPYLLELSRLWG